MRSIEKSQHIFSPEGIPNASSIMNYNTVIPYFTLMKFNDQSRCCHAERSEASLGPASQTLRCAQGDNTFPILVVKNH